MYVRVPSEPSELISSQKYGTAVFTKDAPTSLPYGGLYTLCEFVCEGIAQAALVSLPPLRPTMAGQSKAVVEVETKEAGWGLGHYHTLAALFTACASAVVLSFKI